MRKKDFTLIELLVVIAIIAVLAGMLLPALGNVKKSAMNTKCISNLKQLSLVCMNYMNDNNDFYPTQTKTEGNISFIWACKFVPYIDSNHKQLSTAENLARYMNGSGQWLFPYAPLEVLSCPAFPPTDALELKGQLWRECGMHYAISSYASTSSPWGSRSQTQLVKNSKNRTRTWIFSESCNRLSSNNGFVTNNGGLCIHRHPNMSINAACVDGRVITSKIEQNTTWGNVGQTLAEEYRYIE